MLSLTRSTRATHILSLHARALNRIAHNTDLPNTDAEQSSNDAAPAEVATRRRKQLTNSSAECMFVYPWTGIRSSAEGFALARAVQDKYGPAKEVIFSRNPESVNVFQPYIWLIYNDPNVRKRLPGENIQITLHVADLPRSDGNIGLEEMMHGLGLYTADNVSHPPSPSPTEADPSKNATDEPPEGYKTIDVQLEWARTGAREVVMHRSVTSPFKDQDKHRKFAQTWLAFDGFSPESARGPQTPNLFRAHEKWRKIGHPASVHKDDDHSATTATEAVSPSFDVDEVAESMSENEALSREWVPIIPSAPHSQQRHRRDSARSKNISYKDASNASTPTNPDASPFNAALATAAAEAAAVDTTTQAMRTPAPTEETAAKQTQVFSPKLSRRERILNLARQNARTPLPKSSENPQSPPNAEMIDEESERQVKERTIRERLWRLVGGIY